LTKKLEIILDDEIYNEMSAYTDINWNEVLKCAIKTCLHNREIREMYNPIEKELSKQK
jgi:hypothetical protein